MHIYRVVPRLLFVVLSSLVIFLRTTLEKIRCITKILNRNCSQNAISLVQNYFRELLPKTCEYSDSFLQHDPSISSSSRPLLQTRHTQNDSNRQATSVAQAFVEKPRSAGTAAPVHFLMLHRMPLPLHVPLLLLLLFIQFTFALDYKFCF